MKKLLQARWLLATLAGILFTTLAVAQPAVEWISAEDGGGTANTSTMGYRFKVTSASDIEVAALGAYDSGGNGLGRPHIVAIWPVGGGTPLVTATVPAGVNAYLEGHFRYVNIAPVRLFKDTEYIVGASDYGPSGSTNDAYMFSVPSTTTGFTNAPGIQWLEGRGSGFGSGLLFPSQPANTNEPPGTVGLFGGNFMFQAVPSLPHATLRFSQVEVCWTSESNKQYQVQYQSALTTNAWLNLGSPLPGTGTNNCVNDAIPRGEPQRFYRILGTPLP